jgi:hypothetical protein
VSEIIVTTQITELGIEQTVVHILAVAEQGPQGPPGPPGTSLSYTHTQGSAASTWTVNHNLGFRPDVTIY